MQVTFKNFGEMPATNFGTDSQNIISVDNAYSLVPTEKVNQ